MDSTVRVIFLGDAASAIRSVSTLEGRMGTLGGTAARAGKLMAGAFGIGLAGSIVKATSLAIGFDRSMRNVNSLLQLNEKNLAALEKRVLSLSKSTGQAPKVLADGLYDIASSGFKANDAIKILGASAKAATAGLTDTATSSKAIVAVLNAYHLGANQAKNVSDVLFQTVNKGVLTFAELSQQIGDVLPLASTLKVPLTDVGGALATITLHGVNAAEAATQLKQVFASVIAPSKGLSSEIKTLGFESGQAMLKQLGFQGVIQKLSGAAKGNVQTLHDWFPNIRALNGFLGISGKNAKQLRDNILSMDGASKGAGATARAFAEQGKSIAVQWDKATGALAAAGVKLGTTFFPILATGITKLSDFAGWIDKLANKPTIHAKVDFVISSAEHIARSVQSIVDHALHGGSSGVRANVRLQQPGMPVDFKYEPGMIQSLVASIRKGIESANWTQIGQSITQRIGDETSKQARGHDWTGMAKDYVAGFSNAFTRVKEEGSRDIGRQVGRMISAGISAAAGITAGNVKTALRTLPKAILGALEDSISVPFGMATGILEGATGHRFTGSIRSLIMKIPGIILGVLGDAHAAATQVADAIIKGIKSAPGKLAGLAGDLGGKLLSALGQAAKDAYGWALGIGQKIAQGVLDGIGNLGSKVLALIPGNSGPGTGKTRPGGGANPRFRAAGGVIDRPELAIIGEDAPRYAEFVIPTNPKYRERALGLLGQAQSALGLRGFAAGGGPRGGHALPTAHKLRQRGPVSVRGLVGVARGAIDDLTAAQQRVSDLSRTYDQDQRAQGAVTLPPFTLDVPDDPSDPTNTSTHQVLNPAGIDARVAQLNQLVVEKNGILDALENERKKIEDAITKVRDAIDALVKAIAELQAKAKAEAANARREHTLAAQASASVSKKGGLQDQVAKERAAKKPNKARIARLEQQIKDAGRSHDRHEGLAKEAETNQGRYMKQATDDASKVGDLRSTLAGLMTNRHDLPFDVRDQQIDIAYLQQEIAADRATTVPPFTLTPGTGTGTSTDTGGTSPSGGGSTITDAIVADLQTQLLQYATALALGNRQLGVLGAMPSFERGTSYVPNDMVALLHSGESVRTRDQTASDMRNQTGGPTHVEVHLSGALEALADMIDVRVVANTPTIVSKIGQSADRLRRENRVT